MSPCTRHRALLFPGNVVLFVLGSLCGASAPAAVYTVDTSSDAALSACVAATASDCSLRGAITLANQSPGADTIEFDLPTSDPGYQSATGHWRILVTEPTLLPPITTAILIDGYSQPGAIAHSLSPEQGGLDGTLKIEVRGNQSTGNSNYAFQLLGSDAAVLRGLVVNNYREAQVFLGGAGAHRVEGCFIGTDVLGQSAQLLSNGILLGGTGPYVIGGTQPAERNLISGLNNAILTNQPTDSVRIQGNLLGTNAAGTAAVGNEIGLLLYRMANSLIGGSTPGARNVFSGQRSYAILLQPQTSTAFAGTRIEGNYFGTDVSGSQPLGNGGNGGVATIQANGAGCTLAIGGTAPGQANLIAYGAGAGIRNDRCLGLQTPLNRFYGNNGIAFDNILGGSQLGASPNDAGDADEGGNRLQNYPDIEPVASGPVVTVQFRVDTATSAANYPLQVNFYRGTCGGGSASWLGSIEVPAAQAQQTINAVLTAPDKRSILPLTATAVDADGNTSEFAPLQGDALFRDNFDDTPTPSGPARCG